MIRPVVVGHTGGLGDDALRRVDAPGEEAPGSPSVGAREPLLTVAILVVLVIGTPYRGGAASVNSLRADAVGSVRREALPCLARGVAPRTRHVEVLAVPLAREDTCQNGGDLRTLDDTGAVVRGLARGRRLVGLQDACREGPAGA